ncbi:MAG: hypothetical protein J5942_01920 [Prevotella sp.]|nr:hypothetical protein [Prevotella sp.]MBQ2060762.1 hypothetical protein [Prevotella sp.]MBQ2337669.1 hypothetical protein [Prevotella sp.]MBR2249189.1 hypothetical protein [Prevotella sp.]
MKHRTIIAALMCMIASFATAQNVYNEIYNSSYKTASDPREDMTVRQVALFKVDALTYINTRMLDIINDSTRELTPKFMAELTGRRDSLAYFMYDYVNLYLTEVHKANKQKDKDRLRDLFRDVTITTPLFNDPDRNYVLGYYKSKETILPFSLDTDWIEANATIRRKLKEQ